MSDEPRLPRGRIAAIDVARGVALIAMAIYHFTWDLEFFGYVQRGLTEVGGWKVFARCIASSFLFLVGVGLVLAHQRGIRWRPFLRRWAMIAAAALVISIGTKIAMPDAFIFFGILHEIALASLLGLLFLRVPSLLTLALAAGVIALPFFYASDAFNHPLLWWIGLSSINPRSNDFVPLFPWFGAVLAGMGVARLAQRRGVFEWMRGWVLPGAARPLDFIGRHSLAFYLIHQPILIGLVALAAQIHPPAKPDQRVEFRRICEADCAAVRDAEFCARYCDCLLGRLDGAGKLADVMEQKQSDALKQAVGDMAAMCSGEAEPGAMDSENGETEGH